MSLIGVLIVFGVFMVPCPYVKFEALSQTPRKDSLDFKFNIRLLCIDFVA